MSEPKNQDANKSLSDREEAIAKLIAGRVYPSVMKKVQSQMDELEKRLQRLEAMEKRVKALEAQARTLPADASGRAREDEAKRLSDKVNSLAAKLADTEDRALRLAGERDAALTAKTEAEAKAESLTQELNRAREAAKAEASGLAGERDAALTAKAEAEAKAESLKGDLAPFEELLAIYRRYAAVEDDGAEKTWRKILPTDTPVRFLLCGCRNNTIISHWETMRNRCELPGETDSPEWNTMLDALRFLLERYNSTFDSPVLQLTERKPGEAFDDAVHVRAKDSSPHSGKVSRVLLQGIWDCKNQKALRPCVVIVE